MVQPQELGADLAQTIHAVLDPGKFLPKHIPLGGGGVRERERLPVFRF